MITMRTHRRATAGFTLVEMMVVIIIMAVMLAWALPSYKNLVTQYRLSGELNDIQTDVELARSAAIREGINVSMCPTDDPTNAAPTCTAAGAGAGAEWNTGWLVFTDPAATGTYSTAAGDTLLHARNALSGVGNGDTLLGQTSNGAAINTLTFNRMGGTTSFGANPTAPYTGALTLNDSNNDVGMRRCITITVTGSIQVTSPQTESQNPPPPACP
jgi:type IV fimbrial biogenesis protein FimT